MTKPEAEKLRIEVEKLKLEVLSLSKPWWKKSSYLAILVPSMLAFVSLFIAISTGFLDQEKATLDYRKAKLDFEIILLNEKKLELHTTIDSLMQAIREAKLPVYNIHKRMDDLRKQNDSLRQVLN